MSRATDRAPSVVQVVLSLGRGGLETMAVDLAIGLKTRGFRAAVVALDEGGVLEGPLADAGVEYVVLHGRRFRDPRFHTTLAAHFRRLEARVVHTHMFAPLLHSLPGVALGGVRRVVHTEHSFEYLEHRPSLRRALRWMSRTTGVFTLVGARMLPYYVDTVGISRRRLQVIANGIDPKRHKPTEDQARIRAELRLPANAFVVGSAGRLAPEKNYQMLLAGAAECRAKGQDMHVVLFGDGEERPALVALAAQLGIATSVSFMGWRTDLHRVMGALDVFVLTSASEGLPLALLEAMAMGLPIISTPVGDIPHVVEEGRTGHLVPVGDASGLAARLGGFLLDPSSRRRMGAFARQTVIDGHSHDAMVGRYIAAYDVS